MPQENLLRWKLSQNVHVRVPISLSSKTVLLSLRQLYFTLFIFIESLLLSKLQILGSSIDFKSNDSYSSSGRCEQRDLNHEKNSNINTTIWKSLVLPQKQLGHYYGVDHSILDSRETPKSPNNKSKQRHKNRQYKPDKTKGEIMGKYFKQMVSSWRGLTRN